MSIKRLLPLAGLVALIGCAGATGPNCLVNEPQVADSLGIEVTVNAQVRTDACAEIEHDF
jgi:hypothetical protein